MEDDNPTLTTTSLKGDIINTSRIMNINNNLESMNKGKKSITRKNKIKYEISESPTNSDKIIKRKRRRAKSSNKKTNKLNKGELELTALCPSSK